MEIFVFQARVAATTVPNSVTRLKRFVLENEMFGYTLGITFDELTISRTAGLPFGDWQIFNPPISKLLLLENGSTANPRITPP